MNKTTRKHGWPLALALTFGVIGLMAAFVALSTQPGAAQAQEPNPLCATPIGALLAECEGQPPPEPPTTPIVTPEPTPPLTADDTIDSSSTSASATVELQLTIGNFPEDAVAGSSVELYLEDDYQVPDDIDAGDVYFIVTNDKTDATNDGGRVYAVDDVEIDDDDHFGGDDDWAIQVFIPDMNTGDDFDGYNGPTEGQTVTLVITKDAGVQNPSEEGSHSVGYSVLGPTDENNDGPEVKNHGDDNANLTQLRTLAKISLSDEDNSRGYELTVTGSGFNNGTSAAAHVLYNARFAVAQWWETLDCAGMKVAMGFEADDTSDEAQAFCFHYSLDSGNQTYTVAEENQEASDAVFARHLCRIVIVEGHRAGLATVGSDDKVAVTFEVSVPIFGPGDENYICMIDGEGRASSTDVEQFELEPSIRVVPTDAAAGDTINVFAQDFPNQGAGLTSLEIANRVVFGEGAGDNAIQVDADSIGGDASATATFELPGSISGSPLEGTVRIDAEWGDVSEDTKITVKGSLLTLLPAEVVSNETITIRGEGFGNQSAIAEANITIDGVPLWVDADSLDGDDEVEVSNAGQFVVTVNVWPAGDGDDNPALIPGTHTVRIEDSDGFFGSATLLVKEPTITVTPPVAGPRDYVTVTGMNWPVSNDDIDLEVEIEIEDRSRSADVDRAGNFSFEHRVSSDIAIPSTNQVKVSYGDSGDIVRVTSFDVPEAVITITPEEAQPGDTISLTVSGMPIYHAVSDIQVGGRGVLAGKTFNTDSSGEVTAEGILVPPLDPAVYSVKLEIGDNVALGSLEILPEDRARGSAAQLPEALDNLDADLEAVFYFNNVSKEWSFFDPRPEFAELNTLSELVNGEAYWILISADQENVLLNGKVRTLTCSGDDCWNLEVW